MLGRLKIIRRMGTVTDNLLEVLTKRDEIYKSASAEKRAVNVPRLVAVSKTKPVELILEAYTAGQRCFGENYIQEISEKSSNPELLEKCPDIKWHFIGNCQTNKAKTLMSCPNLAVIETITSEKLASKLNAQGGERPVSVMVQINTSGEENKNGLDVAGGVQCAKFIVENCPKLKLIGLMTIGNLGNSIQANDKGENPDFLKLIEVRKLVAEELNLDEHQLELSMGMSNDYAEAIKMGSTNIRVGSSIFGVRNAKSSQDSAQSQAESKMEQLKI
ncbi:pyridoxal phosphate homeostasis protein [Eurytemora carolleeae]|uniref:pyridoxal phosphate homeostasis protein n=1 Tax=Eurytemora carolleeae TaxID=1294199 RepID=UPI000C78D77E|nr:pyridoxal phosphate homeostasis protein [Eurytemora carolleeae]|eukprot:XP_023332677.1 pyridoxal phosphate homeostasis protein-like [Eurytemora affinis]